jgi:integrase
MVEAGARPKTIRDAKLTPVRAILQWAADNRRIASNPAERITIDVRQKPGEGRRSFSDEEAALILRAALKERNAVRRWVPWLCAYSGARLSEVCQLRREDVLLLEGIWCLKVGPRSRVLEDAEL